MDGVLCNYEKAFNAKRIRGQKEFPQAEARFFENLEEIEDSRIYINILHGWYDVWIMTAPSVKNPNSYTEKAVWVEEHYGDIGLQNRIVMTTDKSATGNSKDILIDDREDSHRQNKFPGELILFGSKEFPNWHSITTYLNSSSYIGN